LNHHLPNAFFTNKTPTTRSGIPTALTILFMSDTINSTRPTVFDRDESHYSDASASDKVRTLPNLTLSLSGRNIHHAREQMKREVSKLWAGNRDTAYQEVRGKILFQDYKASQAESI